MKMKKYREIQFGIGEDIESAIEKMKSYNGELVCGKFNDHMLYSDTDDLDSAYLKITGKTKFEFDKEQEEAHQKYLDAEREHKDSIPQLTKEWIERGGKILDEKYIELWNRIVPIRLGDLYRGMELGASLEIIKKLNAGCELDSAKKIIDEQGHSGMSYGLVCSMVRSLCDRGNEFADYVKL